MTALYLAYTAVRTGQNDVVLALGFEKMQKGPLEKQLPGLESIAEETEREKKAPIAARLFGDAGRDHMEKYGTRPETFARIAVKNHRHSVHNPRSQYREAYSLEEVMASRMVYEPLTLLQACPTSDGAAAAVVVSGRFLRAHPHPGAVEIVSMALTTDRAEDFARGPIGMVGMGMTDRAARRVYEESGVGPEDVQVIELHDCFSTSELITYEGLGLCAELAWQLRGRAERRQVEGVEWALQHNLGLGGACVVALYRRGQPTAAETRTGRGWTREGEEESRARR